MSRAAWQKIKSSKRFAVMIYRRLLWLLLVSLVYNGLIIYGVAHIYLHRPEPQYYSTNGATPPVPLVPLSAPNESSIPLLAGDAKGATDETKTVPE